MLQIWGRGGGGGKNRDNIIFVFLHRNVCCDPSLEQSYEDSFSEGSQPVFNENMKNIFELSSIPFLSGALIVTIFLNEAL